jgi:hypothetical protein
MMTRGDEYLDAMLRHLGAAYYESLHGRASRTDVTRALDTVEEHPAARPWILLRVRPAAISGRSSDVEGCSYRQIADVTGIPLGSVKSSLHRAWHRLRAELGAHAPRSQRSAVTGSLAVGA